MMLKSIRFLTKSLKVDKSIYFSMRIFYEVLCVVFLTVWTAPVPPNCSSANETASRPRRDESSNNVFKRSWFFTAGVKVWRCVCVCLCSWRAQSHFNQELLLLFIFLSSFVTVALLFCVAAKKLENEKYSLNKTANGQKSKQNRTFNQFFWESVKCMRKIFPIKLHECLGFWLRVDLSVRRCWRCWELVVRKHLRWLNTTMCLSRKLSGRPSDLTDWRVWDWLELRLSCEVTLEGKVFGERSARIEWLVRSSQRPLKETRVFFYLCSSSAEVPHLLLEEPSPPPASSFRITQPQEIANSQQFRK